MKKILLVFWLPIMLCLASCTSSDEPASDDNVLPRPSLTIGEKEAVSQLNSFGLDFFKAAVAEQDVDKNLVVSPLSASTVLALLANTGQEEAICKALHSESLDAVNGLVDKYMQWLPNSDRKVKMSLANSIWYDRRYTLNSDLADIAEDSYNCEVYGRDFTSIDALVGEINGWAEKKTYGMIKRVIEKESCPSYVGIMNALYFKGEWSVPFKVENTDKAEFQGTVGTTTVDMMKNDLSTYYFETDEAQVVKLYFGTNFSIDVLLPKESENLDSFIADKLDEHWGYLGRSGAFGYHKVELSFPKFEILPVRIELKEILKKLGVGELSDMNILNDEQVDLAMNQYATVRFDEKGAEAAAETSAGGDLVAIPRPENVTMKVDRPFLFFINEQSTGLCLFAGKVANL